MKKIKSGLLQGPSLDTIRFDLSEFKQADHYPFSLALIQNLRTLEFPSQVTFFVGENGSGKSTLLESIALKAGFGAEGGSKNISFKTSKESTYQGTEQLAECLTFSWRLKPTNGYFFRAESFFNVASHLDNLHDALGPYGGKSLHAQSHGEGFLSFFKNRLGTNGFFIFDEPEAALSPERQLALLSIIHQVCKNPQAQFIIATHSTILLAYPNATIYSCDDEILKKIAYTETKHYQITKSFLDNPERYLHYLFEQ